MPAAPGSTGDVPSEAAAPVREESGACAAVGENREGGQ